METPVSLHSAAFPQLWLDGACLSPHHLTNTLSPVSAFLAAFFHRLLLNFSGFDMHLVYTVSEVHILLLEKLGQGLGGGRVFRVCFGLFWLFFLILHSGFGYLKLCCRLPLVFLVAKWGKKRTWMSNKNTTNSVWFAWLLAWFCLKGGRELLDCNYQTLESFVFCFPQLPKCNFWEK